MDEGFHPKAKKTCEMQERCRRRSVLPCGFVHLFMLQKSVDEFVLNAAF